MAEKEIPKYFSKEIKKTEIKYNIKSLLNKLNNLNKKNKIDQFQPDKKPFQHDYGDSKTDIIELFHESDINKINFFKNNISNSLKNNLYVQLTAKKEKDFDKKTDIFESLIKAVIEGEKEEDLSKTQLDIYGNKVDFYKYYKIHREKVDKYKRLGLTQKINKNQQSSYNPNYNFILKRIISGPEWTKITGRKKANKPESMNLSLQTTNSKNYDLFKKDTFATKSEKKTKIMGKFTNRNMNMIKRTKNNTSKISKSIDLEKVLNIKNVIKIKKKELNCNKTQRNYRKINKSKSLSYKDKYEEQNDEAKKINKLMINNANKTFINYDFIRDRVKMMVNYESHKLNNKRLKEFRGCENGEFLDTLKCFKVLKGEKNSGINFGKIVSRPSNEILPSFMCGVHSRIAFNINMNKSLELNNYSSSRFSKIINSYIPRSFNKYVNLSLLKSENVQPENIFDRNEFKYLANKLLPKIQNEIMNDITP